ncbi:hypothetical protein LTR17_009441 [Elasticomyces elasticus]|nr:hypothetical protein LTR17_009441 [Elasticomyces elasticus]
MFTLTQKDTGTVCIHKPHPDSRISPIKDCAKKLEKCFERSKQVFVKRPRQDGKMDQLEIAREVKKQLDSIPSPTTTHAHHAHDDGGSTVKQDDDQALLERVKAHLATAPSMKILRPDDLPADILAAHSVADLFAKPAQPLEVIAAAANAYKAQRMAWAAGGCGHVRRMVWRRW